MDRPCWRTYRRQLTARAPKVFLCMRADLPPQRLVTGALRLVPPWCCCGVTCQFDTLVTFSSRGCLAWHCGPCFGPRVGDGLLSEGVPTTVRVGSGPFLGVRSATSGGGGLPLLRDLVPLLGAQAVWDGPFSPPWGIGCGLPRCPWRFIVWHGKHWPLPR